MDEFLAPRSRQREQTLIELLLLLLLLLLQPCLTASFPGQPG